MKYLVDRHITDVAINRTIAPGRAWQLESIRMHLAAGGAAGNLTVTVNAGASTVAGEYNVVLVTEAMAGVTDYFFKPDFPIPFGPDDEIAIAYANGTGVVIGTEVYYQGV